MKIEMLTNREASASVLPSTVFAWVATLLASSLPYILWKQFVPDGTLAFDLAITVLLLIFSVFAAYAPSLRPIKPFLITLVAFFFGWHIVIPLLSSNPLWLRWQHQLPPGVQTIFVYVVRFIPAILMLCTLIGSNLRREDLFLRKGNPRTLVQALQHLRDPLALSWLRLSMLFLLIAALVLPFYLSITLHLKMETPEQILLYLPTVLIAAAFNACNEELQFRSIFLARLVPSLGSKQALWITTVIFALSHYYGQPSGVIGVVLAGAAGFIWGTSILETRGVALAWILHFVQDVTILSFLFLAHT